MQTVKIHDSQVIAHNDAAFGAMRPTRYSSRKVAERRVAKLIAQGIQAEVYQPHKGIYIKVS